MSDRITQKTREISERLIHEILLGRIASDQDIAVHVWPVLRDLVRETNERAAQIVERAAIPGHSVAGPARHAMIAAAIRQS